MSSKLIRYNNNMNTVPFGKFNEKELDLFFSICFKLKEQETKELVLTFSELRELANYENRTSERFIKILNSTYDKMLSLKITIYEHEKKYTRFNLFTKYTIDELKNNISIAVNQEFRFILNELTGNYTKFELIDFVSLRSGYSKNVFKLLKQWETVGKFEIDIAEFRRVLDIPESYRMTHVSARVLAPVMEELSHHFLNLKLEKIKKGNKVTSLKFTWVQGVVLIPEIEPKSKNKIKVEHGEQLNMFPEKKVKKVVTELTPGEVEKKKKEMLKTLINSNSLDRDIQEKEINIKNDPKVVEEENYEDLEYHSQVSFKDYLLQGYADGYSKNEIIELRKADIEFMKKQEKEYEEFLAWKKERKVEETYEVNDICQSSLPREQIILQLKDIPESELLGKNGNKLSGGALTSRLKKLAKKYKEDNK